MAHGTFCLEIDTLCEARQADTMTTQVPTTKPKNARGAGKKRTQAEAALGNDADIDAADAEVAAAYRKLDHRSHVLLRPGMYIGSTAAEQCAAWVMDGEAGRMTRRDLQYVPGLLKIYDEILVNAVDHSVRLKRHALQHGGASTSAAASDAGSDAPPTVTTCKVRKIAVCIDRDTGVIDVLNDGEGIDVVQHAEHGCYVPELIFAHMLTGTNYDDEGEGANRTIGGQNGIGAKACNIFCRWFEVETVDRTRKKLYTQRFEDNMSVTKPPRITACSKKPYTRVRFLPDYARFGMADGKLSDDMYDLMAKRVYDVTAVTDPDVAVHLDGRKLDAKSFER